MSYNCCFRNFSSCFLGDHLRYSGSSCVSSYPRNLVYSTGLCSPSTCQLGSSLYKGCQKIRRREPIRCQTSPVVTIPRQKSCHRPRTSTLYSPCWTTYAGSLGSRSSRSCSLGYGSRSCYSLGCGSSGFRPLAYRVCGFPSLRLGSGSCYPTRLVSRSCQSPCYRPSCGSGFHRSAC